MKRFVRIFTAALLTGVFVMTSCSYERDLVSTVDPSEEGMSEISFLVDLPQAMQVATRGDVGTVAENTISDIYVLVFDSKTEDLVAKSKGKNLSVAAGADKNNKVTFKATLPVGDEYIFMVLANAESQLTTIDAGITPRVNKADVLALTMTQTGKWDSASPAIPMWGEKKLTLTASTTPSFELTRMLARINVEVNLKNDILGNPVNNFKLTSVRYYNYNTAGALVPDIDNFDDTNKAITGPTIPSNPGTELGKALLYDNTDITDEKECREKIYVFEAAHNGNTYTNPVDNDKWIDNPCLVIGGKYSTDNGNTWMEETYYRVDFIRRENIKDTWLSVLRNFSYNVVITDVSGSGFTEPEIAVKSAPINMESNVLEWNELDMGEIVFDGVFYLSVSQDRFVFPRNGVTDKQDDYILYVKTDYIYNNDPDHEKSGWYVEKYVDPDGNPVTWLKLNPEKGAPNDRVEAYFTFETNPLEVNREAVVWIVAGRLRYPVYITQRVFSLDIVDPLTNAPLSKLEFEVPANGAQAQTKQFKVLWSPVDRNVSISQDSPQDWNPFPPDWLNPNPSSSGWTITNGTGEQVYRVTAPAVNGELVQQDPFYERESVYSFTLNDGTGSETKSITLHQIHYNIAVDTYGYRLDGNTHTVSVRSNTEWVITNIEEWLYNQDPAQNPNPSPVMLNLRNSDNLRIGTAGGPNLSGESLSFTVVDQSVAAHGKKWGTVFVTFESPDGKFNPVRVGISFPARGMTLLGLGYARDVRAFNPAFNTSYHLQGLNRMLTADVNFGLLPESTVQTEPLNIVGYNCEGQARSSGGNNPDANWYKGSFRKWLNEHNPDIIVITYSMRFEADDALLLRKYMDNGGAVIMYYGGDVQVLSDVKIVLDRLMDINMSTTNAFWGSPEGGVYVLEKTDDPILNGPFGDMRGKNFGTHIHHVGIQESQIANQVEVLCRMSSMISHTPGSDRRNCVNVFRHKTKNLFFVGNAMGTASYYPGIVHWNYDPIRNDDNFRPIPRTAFGPSSRYEVYNSYIFMNAIAWAMSVTNHVAPAGGY